MEKLQVITHPQFGTLSIIMINGKEMFKAKEVALMLGYQDTINAVKQHCKGVVKHHLPTKGGSQTVNLIPEGDVWRLIIRSKLPKAQEIEKWIMDEVLPAIRKTGTYSIPQEEKQLSLYEYYDKKYNGKAVMSIADVEHFTGISNYKIRIALKKSCEKFRDYYLLQKSSLALFKMDNPKLSRLVGEIFVITQSGFEKICKYYGIKVELPNAFVLECFDKGKNKQFDDDFLKMTGKIIPSNNMHSLMGYVQRYAAEIQYYSSLLLTTDKKSKHEEYREKLAKAIRTLRGYVSDVETILI